MSFGRGQLITVMCRYIADIMLQRNYEITISKCYNIVNVHR
jgi:hypothetical protein